MELGEFLDLEYTEKLRALNRDGRFLQSFTCGEFHFSLFKLKDFYVELRRKVDVLSLDSIFAMGFYSCNKL